MRLVLEVWRVIKLDKAIETRYLVHSVGVAVQ